jgi:hypothetical protein
VAIGGSAVNCGSFQIDVGFYFGTLPATVSGNHSVGWADDGVL